MPEQTTLFHGTGIYCLAKIALQDTLQEGAHWGKPGEPHGPRLTRSATVASDFITYNMHWGEGGILAIDGELLAKDYELLEYRDSYYNGDSIDGEEEVAAISPAITDLSRYLKSIVCDPRIIAAARDPELMACAIQECGWPFESDAAGIHEACDALDALQAHPLLNAWLPEGMDPPTHGNWDDVLYPRVSTASAPRAQSCTPASK